MRNYFTFDGVDSRSFGVYTSGQGTFKAPARSYDALEIPGRNGALLGIDSRLGNAELTYPAFIYSNFAENIAAFRAFLLSHKGYFKLKDSYHPDEFRLAYYPGPFEPDVTSANNAGSFDITFICKPQRYLESGEEVIELIPGQSETHTYTGNPASFVALGGDQITSLQIPLRFYQDLHGYDHPWPAGGGVNKCSYDTDYTPTAGVNNNTINLFSLTLAAGTYTFSCKQSVNVATSTRNTLVVKVGSNAAQYENSGTNYNPANLRHTITFTVSEESTVVFSIWCHTPSTAAIYNEWQVESGSFTAYAPYSNVCPITGLTGLSAYVSPTQDPDDATSYAVYWTTEAGTVYHGTVDVVTGVLTVTHAMKDLGSLSWTKYASYHTFVASISDMYPVDSTDYARGLICSAYPSVNYWWSSSTKPDFSISHAGTNTIAIKDSSKDSLTVGDFKTAVSGIQLVYELNTPITYQLTPVQIAALLAGETFVWSSNNEGVTVEVTFVIPTILENPTLFDALPFLRVYGTGILGIGSHTITITAADVYTDIDCEMMDCFKGSANKNQYVQFSGNDFPTLEPGVNGFSFSGITKVEVKPRWWSV